MNYTLVVKRFVQAAIIAFALLFTVYLLRGQPLAQAAGDAALWSLISAAIYAAVLIRKLRRHPACAVRRD